MIQKGLLVFSAILWVVLIPAPGQGITVTNPPAGATWCKGDTCNIQWSKTGSMDAQVKIRLFNAAADTKIMNIVNSTPNNGSYSWTVPGSVAPGNYTVMVKTLDNTVWDISDVFEIDICSPSAITVHSPSSDDTWYKGQEYGIHWTKSGSMDGQVKIRLFNAGGNSKVMDISNNTPNDGEYAWTIPASVAIGSYTVMVKTLDNTVWDLSEVFAVNVQIATMSKIQMTANLDAMKPDLVVCLDNNLRPPVGGKARIHAYVKNKGRGRSKECVLVFHVGGKPDKTFAVPALGPDQEVVFMRSKRLGHSATRTIHATIDATGQVDELHEDNNYVESKVKWRLPHEDKYTTRPPKKCSDGSGGWNK